MELNDLSWEELDWLFPDDPGFISEYSFSNGKWVCVRRTPDWRQLSRETIVPLTKHLLGGLFKSLRFS